jgi:ribosomal protein L37E
MAPTKGYQLVHNGQGIQCLRCLHISYHPRDIEERYCGYCHRFHDYKLPSTVATATLRGANRLEDTS